jgi:hypothetical protein
VSQKKVAQPFKMRAMVGDAFAADLIYCGYYGREVALVGKAFSGSLALFR